MPREVPAYCWPARYAHVSLCAVRLGGMSAAASAPRSCSGCANGVVAPKLAAQGWLPPRQTCRRRSAVTRDPSEVDCSRADSADARGSLAAGARAGAGSGSDVQTGKPKEVARSDTGAGAGVEERAPLQNSLI